MNARLIDYVIKMYVLYTYMNVNCDKSGSSFFFGVDADNLEVKDDEGR